MRDFIYEGFFLLIPNVYCAHMYNQLIWFNTHNKEIPIVL